MASSSSSDSSSSDTDCSSDSDSLDNVPRDPWRRRHACTVNHYPVSLRREQDVSRSNAGRQRSLQNRRQQFLREYDFEDADDQSIINTQEAHDLRVWCTEKSWAFCGKCGKLSSQKLLPSFRTRCTAPLEKNCKCGGGTYMVPQVDDVPLQLRNLSSADIRVLRPFEIHCGEYRRIVHGYRQRTGPFRVTWSALTVEEKISAIEDRVRRRKLRMVFDFLMAKRDSSYSKFVIMQARGVSQPFTYQIFSGPDYKGIECALWPTLYHSTALCESLIRGQTNRASGKISFIHKVLSPVLDFSLDFELLQYQ